MKKQVINKPLDEVILEFFSRVWTPPYDLKAIDDLMAEDYIITTGGKTIVGRDNFKKWVQTFQEKLKNATTISKEIIINKEQDRIISRFVCTGKNNGIFNLHADHKNISFTGIAIWKVQNGKLQECWVERNAFEIYHNLIINN